MVRSGKAIALAIRLLLVIGLMDCAHAQTADLRSLLLNNVARIQAPSDSGVPKNGYGLIVGRELEVLWVATAAHVVKRTPTNDNSADYVSATIYFYGSAQPFRIAAEPRWTNIDIVFLPVHAPLGANQLVDDWISAVIAPRVSNGDEASLLGSSADAIAIAPDKGRIQLASGLATPVQLPDVFNIQGLRGLEGQSGAPVATAQGIVGIYFASGVGGPSDAQVISIVSVKRLAEARSVRWELIENSGPSPVMTRLCIRHLTTERPAVMIGGQIAAPDAAGSACVRLHAGTQAISSTDLDLSCSPSSIKLAEEPSQEVAVSCAIALGGIWTNNDLGGGQLTPITGGKWAFEGLDLGPYGHVSGQLSGVQPQLYFDGQTANGRPLRGFVHVDRKVLAFHLTMTSSGTPFSFSLTRP